eukprot:140379-Chlamydomonas_euryale.AAC.2
MAAAAEQAGAAAEAMSHQGLAGRKVERVGRVAVVVEPVVLAATVADLAVMGVMEVPGAEGEVLVGREGRGALREGPAGGSHRGREADAEAVPKAALAMAAVETEVQARAGAEE